MSELSSEVKTLFANRTQLTAKELKQAVISVFNTALEDKDTAELITQERNRITINIPKMISESKIVDFLKKYPNLSTAIESNWYLPEFKKPHEITDVHPIDSTNPNYQELEYRGKRYPLITRNTRNFNQILFSAGNNSREIIRLDPDSLVLKKHYQYIKDITLSDSNTEDILTMVCETTRGVFTDSEEKEFIQNKLKEDDSFIVLDDFMEAKIGVCTHHALLNAYILSRLIDDGFLKGQVIHYQQQLNDRTHVWNLFIDEQDGNRYSLDSLLRDVTSITEKPGALDKLYRSKVEAKINKLFPPNATIKSPQETLQQKAHAILNNIANYIELNSFVVASYILFSGGVDITLPNSGKKRVPHRIADIYQLITQGQTHGQEEHLLKQVKKIARDALANPRTTQDIKTKEFYKQITEDKVLELISTSQKPSGQNTL